MEQIRRIISHFDETDGTIISVIVETKNVHINPLGSIKLTPTGPLYILELGIEKNLTFNHCLVEENKEKIPLPYVARKVNEAVQLFIWNREPITFTLSEYTTQWERLCTIQVTFTESESTAK